MVAHTCNPSAGVQPLPVQGNPWRRCRVGEGMSDRRFSNSVKLQALSPPSGHQTLFFIPFLHQEVLMLTIFHLVHHENIFYWVHHRTLYSAVIYPQLLTTHCPDGHNMFPTNYSGPMQTCVSSHNVNLALLIIYIVLGNITLQSSGDKHNIT